MRFGSKGEVRMTVSLRVVGIFFILRDIPYEPNLTVKKVLEQARNLSNGNFDFEETVGVREGVEVRSPSSFTAIYTDAVTSPSSQMRYPAGAYKLSECLSGSPYTVWQYYIKNSNGLQINTSGKFVPYDDPAEAIVPDGGSVIFRLLQILARETGPVPRLAKYSEVS